MIETDSLEGIIIDSKNMLIFAIMLNLQYVFRIMISDSKRGIVKCSAIH